MDTAEYHKQFAELERRRQEQVERPPEAIQKVHDQGLLTSDERLDLLLDPTPRWRFGQSAGASPVDVGIGEIHGRPVAYKAHDLTVNSGIYTFQSMGLMESMRGFARRAGIPVFQLFQGGGGMIDMRAMSSAFAAVGGQRVGASWAFPARESVFTAVLGNAFAPWAVASADFAAMSKNASATVVSPFIVEFATGKRPDVYEMGGAEVHSKITGQVHRVGEDEAETIGLLRKAFSYLPSNAFEAAPRVLTGDPPDRRDEELRSIVPPYPNRAYDVRKVIERIVDRGSFFEWLPEFGKSLITGLCRFDGYTVAIMANQPTQVAGTVGTESMTKLQRLMRCVKDHRLPLVTLTDTPGALTTLEEEHKGLLVESLRSSAELLHATGPNVGVVLGKGIGFGYFLMGNSSPESITLAWPQVQIAYLGAEGGASVVHRKKLASAGKERRAMLEELASPFRAGMSPWRAAHMAVVDNVIDPADTRPMIIRALDAQRSDLGAQS